MQFWLERPIGELLNAHSDFCVFWREPCQHTMHAVPSWCLTCIHAIVSRSPWVHGSVAPFKSHCQQWMSSLFCGFLPNPFIQDLFLWRTSQEFVKTDLYPLSLISLRYAVCLTGCWSIIGCCVGACQRSNCNKKTNSLNINEKRHLFGCPDVVSLTEKLLMARNFFPNFHWK